MFKRNRNPFFFIRQLNKNLGTVTIGGSKGYRHTKMMKIYQKFINNYLTV